MDGGLASRRRNEKKKGRRENENEPQFLRCQRLLSRPKLRQQLPRRTRQYLLRDDGSGGCRRGRVGCSLSGEESYEVDRAR